MRPGANVPSINGTFAQRLELAARVFEHVASQLRAMARGAQPGRKKLTIARPDLFADLGLVLGDQEEQRQR
jgi:hypothetical protein